MKNVLSALSLYILLAFGASAYASSAYAPVPTSPSAKAEKEFVARGDEPTTDGVAYGGANDGQVESGTKSMESKSLFVHH